MMADSPTSGGYPIIAVVIRADLPLLAQCEPLKSQVRFRQVSPEQAREAYMVLSRRLEFLDTDPYNSDLWERAGSIQ
jgi:antagonist of KipI